MKNLRVSDYLKTKNAKLMELGIIMVISLTSCGIKTNENTNLPKEEQLITTEEKNIQEGILVIGDEIFLIKYLYHTQTDSCDKIIIKLEDGTLLSITRNNFYEYDENSETMDKIKQLVIEEDHIIQ